MLFPTVPWSPAAWPIHRHTTDALKSPRGEPIEDRLSKDCSMASESPQNESQEDPSDDKTEDTVRLRRAGSQLNLKGPASKPDTVELPAVLDAQIISEMAARDAVKIVCI